MPKYQLDTVGEVRTLDELRAYRGLASAVVVSQGSDAALYVFDESDLSSSDDGLNTIVGYDNRRWDRTSHSLTELTDWATKTDAPVITSPSNEYSAKEYAQGTQASTGGSSKNWAQQTGGDVTGASANSRSAKAWAQEDLTGATLGGSAKDWAQSSSLPDGTNKSAKTYATEAATSSNTALAAARIYADTTAGLAAVASGEYFYVPATSSYESLILYKDNAGVAEEVKRFTSQTWFDDAFHERFFAAQARSFEEKRTRVFTQRKKEALVLIGLGQSNNAAYNTPVSGTVTSSAVQFVGGNAVGDHDFYSANQAHSVNWADVASTVAFTTGTVEHPLTGAITMLEGLFPKIYAHSAAYGGNAILMLSGAARLANLCAYVHKMCDHARTDGYEPVVAFTFVQGEANMSSFGLLSETNYYTYLHQYLRIAQRVAAQAMDRPDYKAPIVLHNPAQSQNGADSRGINNAIGRVAAEIPNAILGGGLNQWNVNADLIHGTAVGFRQRGEQDGWLLTKFFAEGRVFKGVYPVDAYRSGASLVVTFNDEIEHDATATWGSATPNAANSYAGCEYTYDGTNYVDITGVSVTGRRATFTLASDPGVAAGTEEFRCAMQTSDASGTWPQDATCAHLRSTRDRFVSPYDGSTQYVWASPRKLSVRAG